MEDKFYLTNYCLTKRIVVVLTIKEQKKKKLHNHICERKITCRMKIFYNGYILL